jgi:hypothetical protein
MRRITWFLQLSALLIGVQAGIAPISLAASAKPQLSPTAITDIKSIAGKWEGIMIRTPKSRTDDWVNVTIQDTGDYDFASYRTIGVFSGKGKLTVADGKATGQGERGKLTLQLFTDKASGQPMLRAEGKAKDGLSYRAELKKTGGTAPGGQK